MPRGARLCVAMLVIVPGCLTAPPDSVGEDGAPPTSADAAGDGAASCASIVRDKFLDEELWLPSETGSGDLTLFDDHVDIDIVTKVSTGYVSLTSTEERAIEGTRVEANLVVERSDAGNVSIAFDGSGAGGGFYEIHVASGVVESVREDGTYQVLCGEDCPAYDRQLHRRFRLRARQGLVHYESFDGLNWNELVPAEAGSSFDFTVSLKAVGEGTGAIDAVLHELAWQACGE